MCNNFSSPRYENGYDLFTPHVFVPYEKGRNFKEWFVDFQIFESDTIYLCERLKG